MGAAKTPGDKHLGKPASILVETDLHDMDVLHLRRRAPTHE